mmetsp:Transcript_8351/g.19584  ORF Transcript_8351/g.19584 Transcript_8351/m.19584 type:complete len:211 (+) Transcript_8351:385-1017(+)
MVRLALLWRVGPRRGPAILLQNGGVVTHAGACRGYVLEALLRRNGRLLERVRQHPPPRRRAAPHVVDEPKEQLEAAEVARFLRARGYPVTVGDPYGLRGRLVNEPRLIDHHLLLEQKQIAQPVALPTVVLAVAARVADLQRGLQLSHLPQRQALQGLHRVGDVLELDDLRDLVGRGRRRAFAPLLVESKPLRRTFVHRRISFVVFVRGPV